MKQIWMVIFLMTVILTVQAHADEQAILKTDKDKVNYSIGVNIINTIKLQGIEVDLDLVIKGMRDAFAGEKLLLEDIEIRKAINQYIVTVKQKRAKAQARAAEEKKKIAGTVLPESPKKETDEIK